MEPEKEAYIFCAGGWLVTLSRARSWSGLLFLCWRWRARGERNCCEVSKVETWDEVFTPSNGNLESEFVSEETTRKYKKLTNRRKT